MELTRSRSDDTLTSSQERLGVDDEGVVAPDVGHVDAVESVRVILRIRPSSEFKEACAQGVLKVEERCVTVQHKEDNLLQFPFDGVVGPQENQSSVYEHMQDLVGECMKGCNVAAMAYGSTGTGKTFTMFGPGLEDDSPLARHMEGVCPRMLRALFQAKDEEEARSEEVRVEIEASFLEIYNERLRDLLMDVHAEDNLRSLQLRLQMGGSLSAEERKVLRKSQLQALSVRGGQVVIKGATSIVLQSPDQAMQLVASGLRKRATASTGANSQSSRSHAVFLATIQKRNIVSGAKTVSQMYLCDLAGAESVAVVSSSANSMQQIQQKRMLMQESQQINRSLHALGMVITALSDGTPGSRIPYRDSTLTRILQNCLGGNARAVLMVTASASDLVDMVSTCRFGQKTKKIKNRVTANRVASLNELQFMLDAANAKIKQQQEEIQRLSALVDASSKDSIPFVRQAVHAAKVTAIRKTDVILESLLCPITGMPFVDCVVLVEDGYSYSRAALLEYLNKNSYISPLLGIPLVQKPPQLVSNVSLQTLCNRQRSALELYLKHRDSSLLMLTRDTLLLVARFLDGKSLFALSRTCSRLRFVFCHNAQLWVNLLIREAGACDVPASKARDRWIELLGSGSVSASAKRTLVLVTAQ